MKGLWRSKLCVILFVWFFSSGSLVASNSGVRVSLVNSTAIGATLPFEILEGKPWKAIEHASYVKLHIYLDESFPLGSISVQSCGAKFQDDAMAFINFTEMVFAMKRNEASDELMVDFPNTPEARSITINFGKNRALCLKNFTVKDETGKKVSFILPERVDGTIDVSLETGESYQAMNLFDSRFEYAWSPVSKDKEREIEFHFAKEVRFSGLMIWNGYLRSAVHCVRNGRVKKALITGDGGFSETISVQDVMEPQRIDFQNEFRGKNLKIKVISVYGGKKFDDPVISELRFLDGDQAVMINPLVYMQEIRKTNTERFTKAGFAELLDQSIQGAEEMKRRSWARITAKTGLNMRSEPSAEGKVVVVIPSNERVEILEVKDEVVTIGSQEGRWNRVEYSGKTGWVFDAYLRLDDEKTRTGEWTLRLRGDGSLYMDGTSYTMNVMDEQETKVYYILGNYRIIRESADEIEMVLFGLLRIKSRIDYLSEDCNGCGHDCNLLGKELPDGTKEIVFVEKVRLIKVKNDPDQKYRVVNEEAEPILGFKSIFLR